MRCGRLRTGRTGATPPRGRASVESLVVARGGADQGRRPLDEARPPRRPLPPSRKRAPRVADRAARKDGSSTRTCRPSGRSPSSPREARAKAAAGAWPAERVSGRERGHGRRRARPGRARAAKAAPRKAWARFPASAGGKDPRAARKDGDGRRGLGAAEDALDHLRRSRLRRSPRNGRFSRARVSWSSRRCASSCGGRSGRCRAAPRVS